MKDVVAHLRQDGVSLAFERRQDAHDSVGAVDASIIRCARDGDVLGDGTRSGHGLHHPEDGESDESNA